MVKLQVDLVGALLALAIGTVHAAGGNSRLSDEPLPFLADDQLPKRTAPILEIGDAFLGQGNIRPGFTLPTGAVWQPRLWVYGSVRSAYQVYDRSEDTEHVEEFFNRIDLFGNLQLTGSERILVGIRPLNDEGKFTGWQFEPDGDTKLRDETNFRVTTLFFEGDFGEIFPRLDPRDSRDLDVGFSVGRQQISFQDGLLVNDTLDSVGVTRNNLRVMGWDWLVNLRVTGLFAWNEVHRDNNLQDRSANLYGLFTAWDTVFGNHFASTFELDVAVVDGHDGGGGDLVVAGFGATQRIGLFNTTFRVLGSQDFGSDGRDNDASDDGILVFTEISKTPFGTDNLLYTNFFWGIDNYSSAARDPLAGGPLGRAGISFAARGIGTFPAPLGNRTDEAVGLAIGYQMFFDNNRRQVIVELGGRHERRDRFDDAAAVSVVVQQAVGRRILLQLDGFAAIRGSDDSHGIRTEILYQL
jgi:hypothetical protein